MMSNKVSRSFGALYTSLENRNVARWAVIVLLTIHTGLLAYSAFVHSPTLNEPGHLVAGLSHWKFGRFEVYRVNPPLVKMIAALPVMATGYEEDWSGFYEGPGARPEMAMGADFMLANGERSFLLFTIARWACIPFSWIGAITCYLWARDLYGRPEGVMACAIWCFEPNILAHASLVTPDIGGTALGVAACYTFWKWLRHPTWLQVAMTGVVLGVAELCKTTLVIFYPLWPFLWIAYRLLQRRSLGNSLYETKMSVAKRGAQNRGMTPRDWLREAGMLALRMAIGLYILNLGYCFEGTGTPLRDFHFVSDLFSGRETSAESREQGTFAVPAQGAAGGAATDSGVLTADSTNRLATTWWGVLPVPLPKNYLLGIDLQQKDFEQYDRQSYLRGDWRDRGWWYYYVYAATIKVPLGLWVLALLAILVRTSNFACNANQSLNSAADSLILLAPPLLILCVASAKTGFSEHFRYILPCFPFLFIWISQTIVVWRDKSTCVQPDK
jgi:hypothetical protein